MPRFVQARYANLTNIVSWEFTLSHGPFPSTGQIVVTPHTDAIPEGGQFIVRDDTSGARIVFSDCATERGSLAVQDRHLWTILFLDRRWKWQYGTPLDGYYNLPISGGRFERRKEPQELVRLCLDSIGETGVDLSSVPTNVHPTIRWTAERPDEALGALLDELGLRVVLGADDRIRIVRRNLGANLPVVGLERQIQLQLNRGSRPEILRAIMAPVRFQVEFELEAVGEDTDGKIKPIDDLSYKPAAGWSQINLPDMSAVQGTYRTRAEHLAGRHSETPLSNLARRSVFRMYRIKNALGRDDFTPPGWTGEPVTNRESVLPLYNQLNETYEDVDGIERQFPANVEGTYFTWTFGLENHTGLYERPWSLDADRGIVLFNEYTYKMSANLLNKLPADLTLTCTVELTSDDLGVPIYRQYDAILRTPRDNLIHAVPMSDIQPQVTGSTNNFREVDGEALKRLRVVADRFGGTVAGAVTYSGIYAIQPDGAIQQVQWSGGRRGFFTTASRGMEVHLPILEHDKRKERKRQKAQAEREAANEKRAAARRRRIAALTNQ